MLKCGAARIRLGRNSEIVRWRRRRDSNPRYAFGAYNGLANRRLQPLGHVSSARGNGYRNCLVWSNSAHDRHSLQNFRCRRHAPLPRPQVGKVTMNCRQRRAALKQNPPRPAAPAAGDVRQLFALALQAQGQHRLDEAARAYRRVLAQAPDHAEASNNLGCVLQAQGKLAEASACFAQALTLVPQLADNFPACAPRCNRYCRRSAPLWRVPRRPGRAVSLWVSFSAPTRWARSRPILSCCASLRPRRCATSRSSACSRPCVTPCSTTQTRRSTSPARSRASASSTNMYSPARRKKTRAWRN